MSILNNNIVKYAFDNGSKNKNDLEEYKKLLLKYKQVLDWYRQDLQDYNYMFLTRDSQGKVHLNEAKIKGESSSSPSVSSPSVSLEEIKGVVDEALSNISIPASSPSVSLEEIKGIVDNALSTIDLSTLNFLKAEDLHDVWDNFNTLSNNLDLLYNKLEKIDNSFSDYVYSDRGNSEYEGYFDSLEKGIEELKNGFSNLESKTGELNQKLIHLQNNINAENEKPLSQLDNIERKIDMISREQNLTNKKILTVLSISTILNVIGVALLLYFIF